MFGKLFKHVWRDNFRIMGILTASLLVTMLLEAACLFLGSNMDNGFFVMLAVLLRVLMFVVTPGLVVYPIAVLCILLVRFYKNNLTAEGISKVTPPAKARHVFLASLLNMLIWLSISLLLWMLAKELLIHAVQMEGVFNSWYWDITIYGAKWPMNLIQLIVAGICCVTLLMTCLIFGSVMPRKLSLPVTIVSFLAVIILANSLCLAVLPKISVWYYEEIVKAQIYSPQEYPLIAQLFPICLQIIGMIGCYFLSVGLLKKKWNLC